MSVIKTLILLLTVLVTVGCKSSQDQSRWAGQGLYYGWHDEIWGSKIPEGYASPDGSYQVHFPISSNHIFIRDGVLDYEVQKKDVQIYEVTHFSDIYGYNSLICSMFANGFPPIEEIEYSWIAENLRNIYNKNPPTRTVKQHEKYGTWLEFTFGPYPSKRDHALYRIEAFFMYKGMVYRVITVNNFVSDRMKKVTRLTDEQIREMAKKTTTKHFNNLLDNLILLGDQHPEETTITPGPLPQEQSEPQGIPFLLL